MFITLEERNRLFKQNEKHFSNLLEIIKNSGELLEGNCVYLHNSHIESDELIPKQRNLMTLAKHSSSVLEIGFNAGHSALLMLMTNPNLTIKSIDICSHAYTKPCYKYLSSVFPGRIILIEGNSKEALKTLREPPYDVYHIDGCHSKEVANSDFLLCRKHSKNSSIVVWDDVNFRELGELWESYKDQNYVEEIRFLETHLYPHICGLFLRYPFGQSD